MSAELLFEIGCEEIPAAFLPRALGQLAEQARVRLGEARLAAADVRTMGTPRRLALLVSGLADRQPDLSERVVGPPVSAAFDAAGAPTRAALGFAAKNGVDPAALERAGVAGKKGEYVVCTRVSAGRPAREVLPPLLEGLVGALGWPKSMRWGDRDEVFVRPVHWLVALFGGEVLPISFAGVSAGRATCGHRFLAPAPINLAGDAAGYAEALRGAFVIVDPAARRRLIADELARLERETGARVRPDEALLDEVAFLVEYPVAVCGEFERGYLEVPEEVIVSAMRTHQRYFAMEGEGGALVNRFATIAGTVTRDADQVRHGNERVLAARLADARFFFREDQKRPLAEWGKRLDGVVFQAKLGSIGDKTRRLRGLARDLAEQVGLDPGRADRAAELCKADLVTHVVGEFPDLQGVMGRHYARLGGEPDEVCAAIADHYAPRGAADKPPRAPLGAVVGIADRIDTIVGCFAVGLAPTGSADPYGLRRAALGLLATLLDRGWRLSLVDLIGRAAIQLGHFGNVKVSPDDEAEVREFCATRLRGLLVDAGGLAADCVDAALAAGCDDVVDARARAEAVARLRARPDFEPLAVAFKRVANILKGESVAAEPDPAAFHEAEERVLWEVFVPIRDRVEAHLGAGDYHAALRVLTELKDPVDRFFDKVLVMDKDEAVRQNRLALLGRVNATFTRIADFRQLAV